MSEYPLQDLTFATPPPGRSLPSQFSRLMSSKNQVEWRAHSGWSRGCHSMCERWLTVWRWYSTQEVGCVIVMGSVVEVMVCPLVLSRLCCNSSIVCGFPVGFRWSVKISWRMAILEQQDGAVVGLSWPLLASSPLKHNSGFSSHTSAVDIIKGLNQD